MQVDLDSPKILKLVVTGSRLNQEDAMALEKGLLHDAEDVRGRAQLLGFYSNSTNMDNLPEARRRHLGHLLWFIENSPSCWLLQSPYASMPQQDYAEGYAQARTAWLRQVESEAVTPQVLANAANFVVLREPLLAEKLLRQACDIDPLNPRWHDLLGQAIRIYLRHKRSGWEESALTCVETALSLTPKQDRGPVLEECASTAFAAGEYVKAEAYATDLLRQSEEGGVDSGFMLHRGHVILGRLAVRRGDVAEAARHLLAAADVPPYAALMSFGPNMSLAKELLEAGKPEAVIEYLGRCGRFWQRRNLISDWLDTIRSGGVPDFGANLYY